MSDPYHGMSMRVARACAKVQPPEKWCRTFYAALGLTMIRVNQNISCKFVNSNKQPQAIKCCFPAYAGSSKLDTLIYFGGERNMSTTTKSLRHYFI